MTDAAHDLWVGIDVGTQSVRVVVVSGTGVVHGRGTAPVTSIRRDARHEQEPEGWWQALQHAALSATADVSRAAIRGLALCATSGTIVLVDSSGRAVTNGLMYDDTRAVAEAQEASDAGAALWQRLGYQRMQPAWALPKLMWAMRHLDVPDGARLAHQSDYLNGKLAGGIVATDTSSSLKTGCDLVNEEWPVGVMDALGVGRDVLPPVVRSGTPLGAVSATAADATGLPAGTPIFAGITDGCAAQLGAGVVAIGDWNCVLGTTLVLKGVADEIVADPTGAVYAHRSPDGRWLPGGASSSGTGALTRELSGRDLDALAQRAPDLLPSAILTYPLAGTRGERFPFVAPSATPFYIGRPSSDAERYAALIQAIAFVERLCFDHLAGLGFPLTGRRVLSGGAARVDVVNHLRADVMGHPVTLPNGADGADGMAVLAAAGEYGLTEAAATMVRVAKVIEPRLDRHERLTDQYLRFVAELEGRGWVSPDLVNRAQRGVRQ